MKRYASIMKLPLKSAKVHVESDIFLGGSVLKGTVFSGFSEVRTHFELESDAPEEKLKSLVRNAKRGCFAENMVQTAVPLKSKYTVNGKEVEVELGDG
ncbi:MAG: OsmC family protein [Nitrospinota bacterium]